MPTIRALADAYMAAGVDNSSGLVSRMMYWVDALGDKDAAAVTPEDVDDALIRLTERGQLRPRRGAKPIPAGRPLKGSTVNRYLSTLAALFAYARRLRVLPRAHVSPTRGLERAAEPIDPNRYLRREDVDRLLHVARVLDKRWRKLPALITLAFHTGLRVGNLTALRWSDVDLIARTASVPRTKNGEPIVAALTDACVMELTQLKDKYPDALVFCGRHPHRPHSWRRLWTRACEEAGLPGRNFHQLRHGCGSDLLGCGNPRQTAASWPLSGVRRHSTLVLARRRQDASATRSGRYAAG